jgi:hypothetical protein
MDKIQIEYIQYLHKTLIEHNGIKDKQLEHAIAKERLAIRSVSMHFIYVLNGLTGYLTTTLGRSLKPPLANRHYSIISC